MRTYFQCPLCDLRRGILTNEYYLRIWRELTNSSCGLNTVKDGKAEIKENEIWLEFFSLIDGLQPVGSFADHIAFSPLFQHRTKELPEVVKIVNDKCSEVGHSSRTVSYQNPQDQ